MSLKDDICRHDAPMQHRRVTRQYCIVHHDNPSGVSQPHRVDMMPECSTGDLLARAGFMHQGHGALMHYAVLKGFSKITNKASILSYHLHN